MFMEDNVLLEIKNLHVGYKTHLGISHVLNGVNLKVYKGERVGIIGESGSGKTTTMKSILRILPSNAIIMDGEILYRGKDILKMKDKELLDIRRKHISMIFQDPTAALNPIIKIGELMADIIKYTYKTEDKEEIKKISLKALKEASLPDPERILDSYPFQLSGGMKQRVCIALSLIGDREMIIADEPTTNLDVTIKAQVLDILTNLVKERNVGWIFVSQALGAVRENVDRVYVMYAGTIIESAPAEELFENPLHPYTQKLLECVPKLTGKKFAEGIPGRIPNYFNPPTGCRFHPRCPHAKDICKKEKPELVEVEPNHFVACHLYSGGR